MVIFPPASKESPPMFESKLVDTFSRTHWSVVPILFVPASLITAWFGLRAGVTLGATVGFAALGFLFWTFLEYWLHRTLFHWIPRTSWGERFHFLLHGVHHTWPRDKYRLVMPPAVSISLFWLFLAPNLLIFGDHGWAFHAGMTAGYMAYDIIHYRLHHVSPKTPWMKALRKHHLAHHSPKIEHERKFGVSSTLWDHVFRTV
jgi:sterol desaturase/sphingolipid hydroxylase (fatty acid hydroxylase superfamily)